MFCLMQRGSEKLQAYALQSSCLIKKCLLMIIGDKQKARLHSRGLSFMLHVPRAAWALRKGLWMQRPGRPLMVQGYR